MSIGVLVLVGTPIGNLGDLSPRAIEELGRADLIACEDTRRSGKLLHQFGVTARTLAVVNDHNEAIQVPMILDRLARGERVAVVTDAGMPGISDPGERIVRAVIDAGFAIEVIPGPSAVVTAVVASGFPTGRFVFEGFLPRKGQLRKERLAELARETRTIVLYEAPHRLVRTIEDLVASMGGSRSILLARELTKLHEEMWHGTLDAALEHVTKVVPKGEFVVVIGPPEPPAEPNDSTLQQALDDLIAAGSSARDAAAEVATRFSVSRRRAYGLVTGR